MSDNLELRLKLWNHLAQHGNLAFSDAWFGTREQANQWEYMTSEDARDEKSNYSKEVRLLEQLLSRPDVIAAYKDQKVLLVDLGSAAGHKARDLIMRMPPSHIIYLPVESSRPLIRSATRKVHWIPDAEHNINPLAAPGHNSCESLTKFFEALEKYDYKNSLLDVSMNLEMHCSELLQTIEFNHEEQHDPDWEQFTATPEASELLKRWRTWGEKTINKFKLEYQKILSQELTTEEKRSQSVALRMAYNPGVLWWMLMKHIKMSEHIHGYENTTKDHARALELFKEYLAPLEILAESPTPTKDLDAFFSLKNPYQPGTKRIETSMFGLSVDMLKGNFHEVDFALKALQPHWTDAKRLICLLGQTLGNFPEEEQEQLIRSLSHTLRPGDAFLLGVELAPNPEKPSYNEKVDDLIRRYGGRQEGSKRTVADNFLRITTQLLGIKDDDIKYDVTYENDCVTMGYKVVNPSGILVAHPERAHQQLNFNEGYFIVTARSRKFKPATLTADNHIGLLKKHGFSIDYVPDRTDYAVVLAKK